MFKTGRRRKAEGSRRKAEGGRQQAEGKRQKAVGTATIGCRPPNAVSLRAAAYCLLPAAFCPPSAFRLLIKNAFLRSAAPVPLAGKSGPIGSSASYHRPLPLEPMAAVEK